MTYLIIALVSVALTLAVTHWKRGACPVGAYIAGLVGQPQKPASAENGFVLFGHMTGEGVKSYRVVTPGESPTGLYPIPVYVKENLT